MDGQGRDQSVSCTWTNQPCTASMSQTWLVTTQPYREDKNSAGLGILQGRRGHSHAIWSNAPSSVQPSQMHMVEGRWGIRPPRAAGEKVAPQAKVCFRTGSGKLTSSMRVNPTKISGSIMKAVKLSIRSLRRHVTTQAPSTPTNNMLTLTNVTGGRKIQTAARIRMSPLPFSRRVPAMRSQPRIKGMSRRAATSRPSHLMFKYVETSRGSFAVVRHLSATVMYVISDIQYEIIWIQSEMKWFQARGHKVGIARHTNVQFPGILPCLQAKTSPRERSPY